ncbi:hypothetical protein [Kitasatospora aureofaciens]|uniref:hypothetical protein n=1 Tax=Kitasatospora aureofaciens TaxID=1894 RepID=UPI0037CBDFC7
MSVLRVHAADQEVAAALACYLPRMDQGIVVRHARVSLAVDPEALRAARRIEQAHHTCELEEIARRQARASVAFMRDEILADPGSARLYALLGRASPFGGTLAELDADKIVREVNSWHPRSRWVVVAQHLQTFLERLSDENKKELLSLLQGTMATFGESELADQIAAVVDPA